MKGLLGFVIIAIIAYIIPYISLTWWLIVPIAGVVAFVVGAKWWQSFLAGLFGVGLTWALLCYQINSANEGILSNRMAALLSLESSHELILITALLGGLLAGFAALAASLVRSGIWPAKPAARYPRRRRKKFSFR